MKAPEPTPESREKARPAIDRWRSDYRKCPHWPKLKRRECEDCGAEVVALALDEAVRDTKERCAERILAWSDGADYRDMAALLREV